MLEDERGRAVCKGALLCVSEWSIEEPFENYIERPRKTVICVICVNFRGLGE